MTRFSVPDFVLSSHEFDIVWGDLGLGPLPYPLEVPRLGRTPQLRAEFAREVHRELTDRGLMTEGALDDGLAAALRLLREYRHGLDLAGDIGYPVRALAAAGAGGGVLAVLAGGELWLTRIQPATLASALVEVLPACDPGPGDAISIPHSRISEESDLSQQAMTYAGVPGRRRAGGVFGACAAGRRSPALTWVDTDEGRYLMAREESGFSLAPADHASLARHLEILLSQLSAAQPASAER